MDKVIRIKELINFLNATTLEYLNGKPKISDKEWDNLYFELKQLEQESGIIYPDSPTQTIFYEEVNKLQKVEHTHSMLSLDKTKEIADIVAFIADQPVIAMCKMDGLTCSLRYENGRLVAAETRGNGVYGEDILHNAKVIKSIPQQIPYKGVLTVDGEIICRKNIFENEFKNDYQNTRNFASGSIRLLNSKECKNRLLDFVAWEMIEPNLEEVSKGLERLKEYGFMIVPFDMCNSTYSLEEVFNFLENQAKHKSFPIDGLVFKYNNTAYGRSLGTTAHHAKNAIAYKFYDEEYKTEVLNIEWTMGRTGILTPVAIINPIEIDGATISRVNIHNVSVMKALGLRYRNQEVDVYRANMIIPQISRTYPYEYDIASPLEVPCSCPICGSSTTIIQNGDVEVLFCDNPNCEGKLINRLDHFCSKKGLDIKGLSKKTLEFLVNEGQIFELGDIFKLKSFEKQWINSPGFGPRSVRNIFNAIEKAKHCTLEAFISAIGIPLIGRTVAKDLCKHIDSYEDFRAKANNHYNFSKINGFAEAKTSAIWNFDFTEADEVYKFLTIQNNNSKETSKNINNLTNLNFVITGKLKTYKNRDALKQVIEARGGRVGGAISVKTSYLINNDNTSTSAKNVTAKKLNIPIISEEEFNQKFLQ